MIINRITRNLFPSVKFCGYSISAVQSEFCTLNEISCIGDAVSDGELTCVIYDDLPLVTDGFFSSLAELCRKENRGFNLGDGFIAPSGYAGALFPCCLPEAEKFIPENYFEFLSVINKRVLDRHKKNGVLIYDDSVFIDFASRVCSKAVIRPNVTIEGNSYVGCGAFIGENSVLKNAVIGDDCRVLSSTLCDCRVGDGTTVGPYAYLRNGASVGCGCRVGDFVEIKNSRLGNGVKASHLAYIGDADVGDGTNVGCGAVFCNYDGKTKHRSSVGKNVFIGANVNLVAPVTVGDGSFIAAGGTVTESVPPDSFVIARSKQINKPRRV